MLDKKKHSMEVFQVEADYLASLAAQVPEEGVIVEVGVFRGRSSIQLAKFSKPSVKVYGIDLWENPRYEKYISNDEDRQAFFRNLENAGVREKVVGLRGESEMFSKIWNLPIDLIFIDADHSYEGVKLDFECWYPHVKEGGVMVFHDYDPTWPGVVKLIDETVSKVLKDPFRCNFIWKGVK